MGSQFLIDRVVARAPDAPLSCLRILRPRHLGG